MMYEKYENVYTLVPREKCKLNKETIEFIEPQNKGTDSISCYKVCFKNDGINIIDFDNVLCDDSQKEKCCDVLVINDSDIKYIELKNTLNKNLMKLGNQFYLGDKKAKQILDVIVSPPNTKKYIVVYTNERFPSKDDKDTHLLRLYARLKRHIIEWDKGFVIATGESELIPIEKIVYKENDIIELDDY